MLAAVEGQAEEGQVPLLPKGVERASQCKWCLSWDQQDNQEATRRMRQREQPAQSLVFGETGAGGTVLGITGSQMACASSISSWGPGPGSAKQGLWKPSGLCSHEARGRVYIREEGGEL